MDTASRTGKGTPQATRTNPPRGAAASPNGEGLTHEHRTAKVIELVGASTQGFEDAIRNVLRDASDSTRGITGCSVEHFSVKCNNGEVVEYRVNVKVAFGIERTPPTGSR